jgi:hypothetical protein
LRELRLYTVDKRIIVNVPADFGLVDSHQFVWIGTPGKESGFVLENPPVHLWIRVGKIRAEILCQRFT